MANVTYTVQKGDTLSAIAAKYNTTVSNIVKLNDIDNPNLIYIGETLIISGTAKPKTKSTTNKVTIDRFGPQSSSSNSLFVTWKWTKSYTDYYEVKWGYTTGAGLIFWEDTKNVKSGDPKQSIYSIPDIAVKVVCQVRPIAKKKNAGKKNEAPYWTADWSTRKIYVVPDKSPDKPSAPSVTIEKYKLTAEIDNLPDDIITVSFEVVSNNTKKYSSGQATVKKTYASYICDIVAGKEYKARCKVQNKKGLWSEWSDYSGNEGTMPSASSGIIKLKAQSSTSVLIDWANVKNAESYEIQYTTKKGYFDSSNEVQSMTVESVVGHAEVTGMETGQTYFFRVRAVNSKGSSAWTDIASITIGKKPGAPTTWSSTTTAIVGELLNLYWVHNSEDNSSQTYAELELTVDELKNVYTIQNSTDEEEKDKTSVYSIDTSDYFEGTTIRWRVRTAGVTKEYGDWSIERSIDVYAPPSVVLNITDMDDTPIETLTSLPFKMEAVAGPITQKAIGYHVSITSEDSYDYVDDTGVTKLVGAGEEVYSKFFDITGDLNLEISAKDITLRNNVLYSVVCTASMDSGLTAETNDQFAVSWTTEAYEPNAEVDVDKESYVSHIGPYCDDGEGNLVTEVLLSVYRREFDGQLTELIKDIENTGTVYITDPHPALDYARYRIVAKQKTTGAISYYDMPGIPVQGDSVIIQWDEDWSEFDVPEELDEVDVESSEPSWSGSMLKIPYNIDISDSTDVDVELIEYIGRSHPVSYYGTQVGSSSTWNMEIPKKDKDTLYALRRLSLWMGDVYVREPSGSGYWASIKVSFNQKHGAVTIPITFNVTRVEGGI